MILYKEMENKTIRLYKFDRRFIKNEGWSIVNVFPLSGCMDQKIGKLKSRREDNI